MNQVPVYRRVILKLSGEALQSETLEIDEIKLKLIVREINHLVACGVEVALIIGAGNIIRGSTFCGGTIGRLAADQMGMLATIINGLALRDALLQAQTAVKLVSAVAVDGIVERYNFSAAQECLQRGQVVIIAGGTGNPLVTTDSAAALRGVELGANLIIKATKVDAVYSADPLKNPTANPYSTITFAEVLEHKLQIMDLNAILLCQEHNLPIQVCNMNEDGLLPRVVRGEKIGTLISNLG